MIDIVIIRDPDFDNEVGIFGDDEGICAYFDIDLGRADLSDPDEFAEWAESRKFDVKHTRTGGAATLIASIVRETAENHEHVCPEWAS